MVTFLSLLDKSDRVYHAIKSSFWVSITINHEPCWGTCIIYDILDEEFIQNLICLFSILDFIWRIIINGHFNTFLFWLITFYGPPSLHPHESFDIFIFIHVITQNILYWDSMFSIFITRHTTHWYVNHAIYTLCHFHPISHSHTTWFNHEELYEDKKIKKIKKYKKLYIYIYTHSQKLYLWSILAIRCAALCILSISFCSFYFFYYFYHNKTIKCQT